MKREKKGEIIHSLKEKKDEYTPHRLNPIENACFTKFVNGFFNNSFQNAYCPSFE